MNQDYRLVLSNLISLVIYVKIHTIMKFRVIFANIYQGMHFAGEKDGEDVFFGYQPHLYVELFKKLDPDILCLAEVPFDNQDGSGPFSSRLQEELGFISSKNYVSDQSWIIEDKFYGSAIFSKYKIVDYSVTPLPNPKLETDRPDGSHWVMHDKAVQKAVIQIDSKRLNVFNLHYFPFHHFGRSLIEDEFIDVRQKLADLVTSKNDEVSLITGDFNNKGNKLEMAFPELFGEGIFTEAIEFDRNKEEKYYEGDGIQVDHILFSPGLKIIHAEVNDNYSDHPTLIADFDID